MTREEIDSRAFWADIKVDDYPVVYLSDAIKIIDDFESRTCENCMYAEDKSFQQRECNKIEMYVDKDFGCNKWEAKDD